MAMTIDRNSFQSDYSSRTVAIEVTNLCRQDIMKNSNYVIRVPLSQMSSSIQSITRMGGKVNQVTFDSISATGKSVKTTTEKSVQSAVKNK
ncbi:CpcD phycobilisome linker domain protein [Stanieria cyanosphaera PCC 7437]|uniref:CpcD phycobilisome linker domain protein n=1 Tax=Stanieria cyanosphaera (strain ATCC 29371 / PCC 7437) TaxID=111780 RepID=K9XR47_STAC7|nr:phycobilisome linker polypeptide [Stanieria cyanosphaera]AFZ34541.1 CpcD phycobilisome linker domain protein [Stanieria cyanosphaera PCC 7437]